MSLRRAAAFSFTLLLSALAPIGAAAQTRLLRFPDIHGDTVVFSHGGDLWRAPAAGGLASRLTAHPGQELFAKFSPDGQWLAFTGQYDGDEQVYVIPSQGGVPRQLTWYPARGPLAPRHGYDNQVYGWTPDGKAVLFRSFADSDGGRAETALYTVGIDGGLPVPLPMPTSGAGDFAPDGKRIVYSPLFRDFRTWKRYQGGWAQDLYIYDLATNAATVIAQSKRTERDPMWIGDRIYFVSDRDGTLNLYSYDLATQEVTARTQSTVWDVRWASSDNQGRIVYELDGELEVHDTRSGQSVRIRIQVPEDGLASRPSRYPAHKNVESFSLSPGGERALFVARGDVFTVPIEKGPTRNLTNSSNAHERWARWSPDGKRVAFISDRPGEDQVFLADQAGTGEARALTTGFRAMLYAPEWAPDGKRLALGDKDGKVYVVTVADGKVQEIADDKRGRVSDYAWSPDGAYLAFSLSDANDSRSLHIWSAADGQIRRVTDEWFDEQEPAWDPAGKYLFFLSDREFAPQMSSVEWNFAGNRMTGVFALTLAADGPHPFAPESDEVKVEKAGAAAGGKKPEAGEDEGEEDNGEDDEDDGKDGKDAKGAAAKPARKPVRIDFEGLGSRVSRVPVEADNLGQLVATRGHLLYLKSGAPFYGRPSEAKPSLQIFDRKKRKASTLAADVQAYAVSADGKQVLIRQEDSFHLLPAGPEPKDKDRKTLNTKEMMVDRVPAEEWATIFDEVWRRYRDFFYVENMHGYDWKAIGDRYRALLPHVTHRSDLNYVLGEMVSELNVGHAYIQGGDFQIPERPQVGLPGARFALDPAAGRYRIAKIFRGHNQEEKYRSPLTEVGVDAREGDYVLAIDGVELKAPDSPYRLLQHKKDPVTLTLSSRPTIEGSRKVTYKPIPSEESLLYLDWVLGNLEKVSKATDGRVGYLHIPDMGAGGIYEFIKWFYPQIRKEGLVVDVRSNGGGNVSQWIIERLGRKLLGTRFGRLREDAATYPATVLHGHLVCLLNQTSASDGDIFPYRFRAAGLGPLIGKRSWGGVVGITGLGPLLDGGDAFVPIQGTNAPDGEWIIEGEGVVPDIEVDNDPAAVIAGRDPQLERGIAEVMRRIEQEPRKLPARPPDPVKTK